MMSTSGNSKITDLKGKLAFNKVVSMQRILQLVQRSCRSAAQLFCWPLDTQMSDKLTDESHPSPESKTTQALQCQPSTILIVNVSNSTLTNCVIGSNVYPSVVAESQPMKQEFRLQMHDHARCSCSCGQQGAAWTITPPFVEPQSINIHCSHLNCVIIGDNNYMHIETEEPQM